MNREHKARGFGEHGPSQAGTHQFAFSLIELVMVIILILSTLYWQKTSGSRQQSLKAECQENLQKMYIAMEIFANEHERRFPGVDGARVSEEPLDLLVPRYTSD